MEPRYTSEKQVLDVLKIDSFRDLSGDKCFQFVSMLPNIDKAVAIGIVNQFPAYAEFATNMVEQLNVMCDNVLKSNEASQKDAVDAYKMILNDLSENLKKGTFTFEEKQRITEQMIYVADRISAKDTENKEFLKKIFKYGAITVGVLAGAAVVLGLCFLAAGGSGGSLESDGGGGSSKPDDDDPFRSDPDNWIA